MLSTQNNLSGISDILVEVEETLVKELSLVFLSNENYAIKFEIFNIFEKVIDIDLVKSKPLSKIEFCNFCDCNSLVYEVLHSLIADFAIFDIILVIFILFIKREIYYFAITTQFHLIVFVKYLSFLIYRSL